VGSEAALTVACAADEQVMHHGVKVAICNQVEVGGCNGWRLSAVAGLIVSVLLSNDGVERFDCEEARV
jgi:phosphoribosylformylglycinamidine (FGAM) synthase-like amidotransferase family enzyme